MFAFEKKKKKESHQRRKTLHPKSFLTNPGFLDQRWKSGPCKHTDTSRYTSASYSPYSANTPVVLHIFTRVHVCVHTPTWSALHFAHSVVAHGASTLPTGYENNIGLSSAKHELLHRPAVVCIQSQQWQACLIPTGPLCPPVPWHPQWRAQNDDAKNAEAPRTTSRLRESVHLVIQLDKFHKSTGQKLPRALAIRELTPELTLESCLSLWPKCDIQEPRHTTQCSSTEIRHVTCHSHDHRCHPISC